jgi:hypothetical protein
MQYLKRNALEAVGSSSGDLGISFAGCCRGCCLVFRRLPPPSPILGTQVTVAGIQHSLFLPKDSSIGKVFHVPDERKNFPSL